MSAPKLIAATALAIAALGAAPLAEAGIGVPGKPTAAAATAADYPPGPGKTSVAKPPWEA